MIDHGSVRVLRLGLAMFALAVAALPLFACLRSESTTCPETGLVCPPGLSCSGNGQICISEDCGNGIFDEGEACDDGNTVDGDNCRPGTCQPNYCGDGDVDLVEPRVEVCDRGGNADDCDADCTLPECGDGFVNPIKNSIETDQGEECDPGTPDTDTASCNRNCTIARCGDGYKNDKTIPPEKCDGGGESPTCDIDCTEVVCGDGITNRAAQENCEPQKDQNNMLQDEEFCDRDCTFRACGDGHVSTFQFPNNTKLENCDDGNTVMCGTCSPNCQQDQLDSVQATGSITAVSGSNLKDGETFTIDDGINPARVFEFDKDGSVGADRTRIDIAPTTVTGGGSVDPSDDIVATRIRSAISNLGRRLLVTAPLGSGSQVMLRHDLEGVVGNQDITDTVGDSGFDVTDLSGGAGYDCMAGTAPGTGTGCAQAKDCRTRYCSKPTGTERGTCEQCQRNTDCQPGYCYRGACLPFECQNSTDCQTGTCISMKCQ
jgi:cysteine-rich repeat protein